MPTVRRIRRTFSWISALEKDLVRDTLSGEGARALTWRFHLDPAVTPTRLGTKSFDLHYRATVAEQLACECDLARQIDEPETPA